MNPRAGLVAGTVLVLGGGWLLARNLGLPLPPLERLWPAAPLLLGGLILVQAAARGRRDEAGVFTGAALCLLGAGAFAFTLGPLRWSWDAWWPALLLAAAGAYLAQWLVRPRAWSRLAAALLLGLVGGLALSGTQGWLARAWLADLARWWPAVLILAGLALLGRRLTLGRRPE